MSADRRRWFLINASPDVRTQIEAFPGLHPRDGERTTPLEAVLLTDAELDHTLGLLLLREARALRLYATPAVHKTLCDGSGMLRTLERYCPVEWQAVVPGADVPLADGLSCRAFDVADHEAGPVRRRGGPRSRRGLPADRRAPRGDARVPARGAGADARATRGDRGLRLPADRRDLLARRRAGPARPGRAGRPGRWATCPSTARTAAWRSSRRWAVRRTIFVHMNNTNPILLADTPERRIVEDSGMEVAMDGLEVEV